MGLSYFGIPKHHPSPPPSKTVTETTDPQIEILQQDVIQPFEEYIQQSIKASGAPGAAVAVVKNGKIVFLQGFGVKAAGTHDSVDIHSVFRLASVSKPFAAMAAAIAKERNEIDWNDPVVCHQPDFALSNSESTQSLNIRHLLSHTTGLPRHAYTDLVENGYAYEDILKRLQTVPVYTSSGKIFAYQNVMYSVIGDVLEESTGISYPQLLEQRIFKPLGMNNASATYEDIQVAQNVAQPHYRRRGTWKTVPIEDDYYEVTPAAGVNASISDMGQWMLGLLGHCPQVISQETLQELYQPAISARDRRYMRSWRLKDAYYGMGWRIFDMEDYRLVYHGGYVNGYRAEVALNLENDLGVVVLCNAPASFMARVIPHFFQLYFNQSPLSKPTTTTKLAKIY